MVRTTPAETLALATVVSLDDEGWRSAVTAPEALCERAAAAAFQAAPAAARTPGEVSVLLADDALLHDLNRRYRGIDKPTNVLAFAALEAAGPAAGPVMLGDIAVARETVALEAGVAGKTLADHLSHMVVHGMLHLLGFDHRTSAEAAEMEAIEVRALATLGIADPYDGACEGDVDTAAQAERGR